jgi:hypothetical protein
MLSLAAASQASAKESLSLPTGWEEARIGYVNGVIVDTKYSILHHQLELTPDWRPVEWLSLGARLNIGQNVVGTVPVGADASVSDLLFTVASPGVTVPIAGIRAGGGVHLLLPTSRLSQRASLQVGVGPAVELARDFPLLHMLTLRYSARFAFTSYKYAEGPGTYPSLGSRNSWAVLAHGPSIEFKPIRSLCVSATLLSMTTFLRELPHSPYGQEPDPRFNQRSGLWFSASVDYRVVEAFAVGVGVGNDVFSVLPEAAQRYSAPRPIVVLVRLSLWPASIFD